MFENRMVNGIHATRYVASFVGECARVGVYPTYRLCMEWLGTLTVNGETLDDADKRIICNLLENGKLELETNCREFLANRKLTSKYA